MNFNAITRLGHRSVLQVQKYSPQLLTAAGIIGGITATVLASKATLRLEETLDDIQARAEDVKTRDVEVDQKELAYVYARGGLQVLKLYSPALSAGAVAIVCVVSAQGIMNRRNAALAAAYSVLERGFAEYRQRVEDKLGTEEEFKLRHGIEKVVSSEKTEDGDILTTVAVKGIDHSIYARFFDETNANYHRRADFNLTFLKAQQQYLNDLLQVRGHVFLNDVYDSLGIDRSQAGSVVGWVVSKDGDNYIDFGLYRGTEAARAFINGDEASILLDFNVDGIIWDKI